MSKPQRPKTEEQINNIGAQDMYLIIASDNTFKLFRNTRHYKIMFFYWRRKSRLDIVHEIYLH